MSRKRNSSSQIPRFAKSDVFQLQNPEKTKPQQKKSRSTFFQRTHYKTIKTQISECDDHLAVLYNKNISKFRDLVNSNDKSLLPFISSLRECPQKMKLSLKFPKKTQLEPFNVADKITCNQKVQKDLNDIKGRTKRISNAFYRWHNKTGVGIKNSCFFESKLRETSCQFYKKNTFKNLFNPIEKSKVETKIYKQSEIICEKQRRLFTLQN